ncbi:MAG TPA: serine hydrolase [Flavisolibacter sp.]
MKAKYLLVIIPMFACFGINAQKRDRVLESNIEKLLAGFNGTVGVYVKNLKNGKTAAIYSDTIFPTASMVKIPILIGIMDKMERGQLTYHQSLTYRDSLLYEGVDILGSFRDSERIELSKVLMLMLSMSDNTASLWLQSLAGKGTRINEILDSSGFKHTRVNSRTPGREKDRTQYGWGQTTPYEMATMMEAIVSRKLISGERSNQMLRLLGRNYWDEEAIASIPADVFIASKGGAVDASRSEVLFVNGRGARYIFCICTKNNKDQSWEASNEAWVLTRKLSQLLWDHFSN